MTTTAPRYKAGGLPPVDFVMSDEEERAVRNGFDAAMHRVIQRPDAVRSAEQRYLEQQRGLQNAIPRQEADVETVDQYDTDAAEIAWVGWLLIACLLCVISSGLGYLAGRYFS